MLKLGTDVYGCWIGWEMERPWLKGGDTRLGERMEIWEAGVCLREINERNKIDLINNLDIETPPNLN